MFPDFAIHPVSNNLRLGRKEGSVDMALMCTIHLCRAVPDEPAVPAYKHSMAQTNCHAIVGFTLSIFYQRHLAEQNTIPWWNQDCLL